MPSRPTPRSPQSLWPRPLTPRPPDLLTSARCSPERLANLGSGNTNVQIIDNEREITVRLYGDAAIVQNLSTLRGTFSGAPTDTDLRGTFVWMRRDGRWRLVTNQLTAVGP